MKLKNKILLLTIFTILLFFITGLNVFATDLNTFLSPNAELIKENLPIPSEISGDNYVRIIINCDNRVYLYYFDSNLYENFSKVALWKHTSSDSKGYYSFRPFDDNNNQIWTDKYCEEIYGYYRFDTEDFLNYTLVKHLTPSEGDSYDLAWIDSTYSFVSSNVDIYDTDKNTVVFQRPLVEKGEQSFQEIIQGVKLEEITQTILAILPKIAIVVVSLIALLISSQLLWKQLKRS